MRKLILILLLLLVLVACDVPPITTTPTATVETAIPPPTDTVVPSVTSTATDVPTSTATATETPILIYTQPPTNTPATPRPSPTPIPEFGPELFQNPGFEGSTRPVVYGEINVFYGWMPTYCDNTTVPGGCPALRIGSGNPTGLMMGRPEYKPTSLGYRVHSGATAQQWFCFNRVCRAGVYQTIDTVPGGLYEVGAYIQSWSTNNADETGAASRLVTADDKANSTWQIMVDLYGRNNPFIYPTGMLSSRSFGFADGVYDQYVPISYRFVATGMRTTIFFLDTRLWPVTNNDSYIDDAWAHQIIAVNTPTPLPPTATIPPTWNAATQTAWAATPTRIVQCMGTVTAATLNVRPSPCLPGNCPASVGTLQAGDTVPIYDIQAYDLLGHLVGIDTEGADRWGTYSEDGPYWFAINYHGNTYVELTGDCP